VAIQVNLRKLVAGEHVERVTVDLCVASNGQVRRRQKCHVLVHILVLSALQELSLNDAGVLLCRLIDRDRVIGQVEGDDESAIEVLGNASVETSCESEYLLVVVNVLEEVTLWLVRL
jgi:hypothetical protein